MGADSAQLSEHLRVQFLTIIKALLEKLAVLPTHSNRSSHRVITASADSGVAVSGGGAGAGAGADVAATAYTNPFSAQIQALVRLSSNLTPCCSEILHSNCIARLLLCVVVSCY